MNELFSWLSGTKTTTLNVFDIFFISLTAIAEYLPLFSSPLKKGEKSDEHALFLSIRFYSFNSGNSCSYYITQIINYNPVNS